MSVILGRKHKMRINKDFILSFQGDILDYWEKLNRNFL